MSTTPPFGVGPEDPDDHSNLPPQPPDLSGMGSIMGNVPMGPGGMPDLGALFTQLGRMFSWSGGPVNWDLTNELARQNPEVAGDAPITPRQQQQVHDAWQVAQLWLDPVTSLPASASKPVAWNRAEWVHHSLPQWKPYVEPIAARVASSLGEVLTSQIPPEMGSAAMGGQLSQLMGTMGAAMFGSQLGQALGGLAQEVLGTTDIGLPLAPHGVAALLPTNVEAFARDVARDPQEVLHYLALREAAAGRLFAHAAWLSGRLRTDITRYASDITIDTARLEQVASQLDPAMLSDPSLLEDPSGATIILDDLFTPTHTPAQQQVLDRLEGLLALMEGWVDTVVTAAATPHLPTAAALGESMRRRRAAGGPAELTFANLVGLQLRPRRLREAATLWQTVEATRGLSERDAVWDHPDYLPDPEDLNDPAAFAARRSPSTDSEVDLGGLGLEEDGENPER